MFSEPKLVSSDCLFCQANSPKPKDISLALISNRENQIQKGKRLAFLLDKQLLMKHQNCSC